MPSPGLGVGQAGRQRDLAAPRTKSWHSGARASDEGLVIPSLTIQFEPEDDDDVFDKFVVISPARNAARRGDEPDSPPIAKLAWDVVKAVDQSRGAQIKVRLQDGREGWLFVRELYNPAHYRMFLQNRGGKWRDCGVGGGRLTIASRQRVAYL